MTGKDILLQTLRNEPAERTPWVPFVGVHGGALIGVDAETQLKSAEKITAGLEVAARRYRPDGLPVAFDLQVEAEVLGCKLHWARETPPSVATHPLAEGGDLEDLPAFNRDQGRVPVVLDACRRARQVLGDDIALYGLITGPLTLALHLRGEAFLMDLFDEEESVPQLLDFCADIARQMVDGYVDAGADVIAVVDPMISQIGSRHFEDFIAAPLNRIFDHVREQDALSSLFVCGNASRNLEAMCRTHCDNVSVDENVDLAKLAQTARAAGKSFGGNLQLTVVLLMGDPADAQRDALRCLDQAGEGTGFVLAPGCDLPAAVKPENLEAVAALVHDPYQVEVARSLPDAVASDNFDDVTIPDYAGEDKVIVDVVTLDSAGCAPCTYMVRAAEEAVRSFDAPAEVREHKITGRDGLGYMKKLKATAIPSICIDGVEHFASIIPERSELIQSLQSAANKKSLTTSP